MAETLADDPSPCLGRLIPEHVAEFKDSGLTEEFVLAAGVYTELDPNRSRALLNWKRWKSGFNPGPAIVYVFRDLDGKVMTFTDKKTGIELPYHRLKPYCPRDDEAASKAGKIVKYESPIGSDNHLYIPPQAIPLIGDPSQVIVVTEGEKKALEGAFQGFACVAVTGVWNWVRGGRPVGEDGRKKGKIQLIEDILKLPLQDRKFAIVFDGEPEADKKEKVGWAEKCLIKALQEAGATAFAVRLPLADDVRKVGLDDYLLANGKEAFAELLAKYTPPPPPGGGYAPPPNPDGVPNIVVGQDEWRVNDEARQALARAEDLYQRGDCLVFVAKANAAARPNDVLTRPPDMAMIHVLPKPILRERLTKLLYWTEWKGKDENRALVPTHPPAWCTDAVYESKFWAGVRRLDALVCHPVVLADGTVVTKGAYVADAGLLVSIPENFNIAVPDKPTADDVRAAVDVLLDVVCDFPFESEAYKAAWVAAAITPLARFMFGGNVPWFIADANIRSAGKGLLLHVICLMLLGHRFPTTNFSHDSIELRKVITTIALQGDSVVLFDNLDGVVGNAVIDAALTSTRWKDRIMGMSKDYDGPLNVVWYATGNNVTFKADTARRTLPIRLLSELERPETRKDLKYEHLEDHVAQTREKLLAAGLTIIRAWHVAGRPKHGLPKWGSFQGWSDVVREIVVFAGLPDPGSVREKMQDESDRDVIGMKELFRLWPELCTDRRGVSASQIVAKLKDAEKVEKGMAVPDWACDLREAIENLCGRVEGSKLGYVFRKFKHRHFDGQFLDRGEGDDRTGSNRWIVRKSGDPKTGPRTKSAGDAPHTPSDPDFPKRNPFLDLEDSAARNAGDAGDDPANGPGENGWIYGSNPDRGVSL